MTRDMTKMAMARANRNLLYGIGLTMPSFIVMQFVAKQHYGHLNSQPLTIA